MTIFSLAIRFPDPGCKDYERKGEIACICFTVLARRGITRAYSDMDQVEHQTDSVLPHLKIHSLFLPSLEFLNSPSMFLIFTTNSLFPFTVFTQKKGF